MAGTLGGLWIALKIGVYFLIMKIRYNPLLEVDSSQNRSSSHPTVYDGMQKRVNCVSPDFVGLFLHRKYNIT